MWGRERHEELKNGVRKCKNTLREALFRYRDEVSPKKKGHRWEHVRLNKIARDPIADKEIRTLAASDFASWRDRRLLEVQPGSVLRERNLLHAVIETAIRDWSWPIENPMKGVRWPPQPKSRDRRISQDEIQRICFALGYTEGAPNNTSQKIAVAFLFALETGMRIGEILGLVWSRINIEESYALLDKTKNGDARKVALSNEAKRLLKLLSPNNKSVFGVSPAIRDALFRKAVRRAQIEDLRFHDSRHEAITRLARKLTLLDLAKMVGCRDPKTLQVYYNPTATEIAQQLD